MDHPAGSFRRVREMYEEDRGRRLDMPSGNYIRQQRLDSPEHLGNYIKSLKDGCFAIYPHVVEGNCSYDDDYVILVGLKTYDTQDSLNSYAKKVPEIFQNDIAQFWENHGSGGTYDVLPNNLRVATKFAAEHNSRKRRKIEQKEADAIAAREAIARQEEERRLKQQEEERERLRREKEQAERDAEVAEYMRQKRRNNDITQERHQDARKMATERRRINELVMQLEKELRILCHPEIKVIRFGSFVSGPCSKKSDADMTLLDVGAHGLTIEDLTATLRQIQFHNVSYLPKAKVPVATLFDPAINLYCDVTIGDEIDYRFPALWFA
ncbi:hypothetical protein BGX30_010181 [Mortierella sp. GBA39]|nr:hypothetical protein BGX30_010181 [Mortierella sp. GBA39]